MSDLISRKALLEEIKESQWGWFSREMLLLMLENQPSVTDTNAGGKWIPCSERLPEKTTYYLVTTRGFKIPMYAWFMKTEKTWQYLNSQVLIDNVIAWMPLPPIYKGE
jgi:hypothetical protein